MSIRTIGVSDFYRENSTEAKGNSFSVCTIELLIEEVKHHWHLRTPGTGESDLLRKVLVPILVDNISIPPDLFYCPSRIKLVEGMKVEAEVVTRQQGEDPYVQTYVTPEEAAKYGFQRILAKKVQVVCYSASALLENGGKRSTNCDWEIVTLLCSADDETEHMTPLTMARNHLEKTGGTKPSVPYTSDQWAEAIWATTTGTIRVKPKK